MAYSICSRNDDQFQAPYIDLYGNGAYKIKQFC